jgi:Protein of unknown function (DUF2637)
MNSPLPASAPAPRRNWTRRLVNLLVALAVIAVAAAAFVFSYDGVHAIALLGGMSKQLARYYPGLFDAVLVIACVAAVMLREGRWWARLWAWIVAIVVLAAIGAADVLHAASFTLAHRTTEAIVAAAPVVAVLLAFSLLLTLLRPYRTVEPEPVLTPLLEVPALPVAAPAPPIALPAAPAEAAAEDRPVTDAPPTVEYPVFAVAPRVPGAAATAPTVPAPTAAHSATTPSEVAVPGTRPAAAATLAPEPPTREVPVAAATVPAAVLGAATAETATAQVPDERGEPAPPTVVVPALSPEPATPRPVARGPRGIRYAGGAAPAAAGKQDAAEDDAQEADYWEAAEGGQLAGLVYRADQSAADETANGGPADEHGPARGDGDVTREDSPAPGKAAPELADDASPFATAPFAAAPRLNRVRSTPTPPADEDE